MNLRRQIEALQGKRAAHLTAMQVLSDLAGTEERLFTAEEQTAFDRDQSEVRDIDGQLARLVEAERQMATLATPAPSPLLPQRDVRPGFVAFKGQAFTRYIAALARSKGNLMQAVEIARQWDDETPEVGRVLKAAVAVGTTTDSDWAAPLVDYQRMNNEFIDLLRPATIIGRLTGFRSVPFNIKIPRQLTGSTANWVGEGLSKPVSALAFDTVTLPWAKVVVVVVITQELARFSSPSAEMLVRDDMVATIGTYLDQQFIDPAVAAVPALRPGSINNLSPNIPSTGSTVAAVTADISAALLAMSTANIPLVNPVWIMSPQAAMFLATLRTSQDIFAFPGMGQNGTVAGSPTLMGIPVIISTGVPVAGGLSSLTLLEQSQLMVADDGRVMIDTSTEASLQMDSAPATPPTPLISLWQQNMLGIKAERFIYWMMRRQQAVQEITGFPAATP